MASYLSTSCDILTKSYWMLRFPRIRLLNVEVLVYLRRFWNCSDSICLLLGVKKYLFSLEKAMSCLRLLILDSAKWMFGSLGIYCLTDVILIRTFFFVMLGSFSKSSDLRLIVAKREDDWESLFLSVIILKCISSCSGVISKKRSIRAESFEVVVVG